MSSDKVKHVWRDEIQHITPLKILIIVEDLIWRRRFDWLSRAPCPAQRTKKYIKSSMFSKKVLTTIYLSFLYIMPSKTGSTSIQINSSNGHAHTMSPQDNSSQLLAALSARTVSTGNSQRAKTHYITSSKSSKKSTRKSALHYIQDSHSGSHQLNKVVANAVRFSHVPSYKNQHKQDIYVAIPVGKVISAATNEGNANILAAKRDGNLKAVMSHFLTMKRQGAILTHHTYNMVLDAQSTLRREGSPIAGLLEGKPYFGFLSSAINQIIPHRMLIFFTPRQSTQI